MCTFNILSDSPVRLIAVVAFAVLATGCQTLAPPVASLAAIAPASTKTKKNRVPPSGPLFFVELYPKDTKAQRITFPLNGPVTVQQALTASKAKGRFGKMNIEVVRTTNGQQVKLGVEYVPAQRHVASHTDYALHPGDRVVVTEDESSALNELLGRTTKALGG